MPVDFRPLVPVVSQPVASGDPVTGENRWESMDDRTLSAALQKSAGIGRCDAEMVREAARRAAAQRLTVRDLQVLLLGADGEGWRAAREAAMVLLAARPELAPSVLATHTQVLTLPSVRVVEACAGVPDAPSFTCQVTIDLPSGPVAGPLREAPGKKAARQWAMLALIAQLAHLEVPEQDAARATLPPPAQAARLAPSVIRETLPVSEWEGLGRDRFGQALQNHLTAAVPPLGLLEELEERAELGRVSPRDWWLLLMRQDSPAWLPARELALRMVGQVPGLAAHVINLIRQQSGADPVVYDDQCHGRPPSPLFELTATLRLPGGPVSGRPQRDRVKRRAQECALASLIAAIVGMPDPAGQEESDAVLPKALRRSAGQNPLIILNQAVQSGLISAPVYDYDMLNGLVRCRARAVMGGQVVETIARATAKPDAKATAANRLLARLRAAYQSNGPQADAMSAPPPAAVGAAAVPAPRTPVAPPTAGQWEDAGAAIGWAVGAGCALLFHPALPGELLLYRPDGAPVHAGAPPAPLTVTSADVVLAGRHHGIRRTELQAWAAPVPLLLPALLADGVGAHPSVAGWAGVVRLALHLVAARAVIPAIDDTGQDVWRPLPDPHTQEALRRAAAALPPHAHAVTAGTNPLRIHTALPAAACVLDHLIETLVRSPGAALLHGAGAYASPPAVQSATVQGWADGIERGLDPLPEPDLLLTIQDPDVSRSDDEVMLCAHLTTTSTGPDPRWETVRAQPGYERRVRRVLRRAAAVWPPLARLAHAPVPESIDLTTGEAAELLGEAGRMLADAGVRLAWPASLAGALDSYTVLGAGSAAPSGGRGLTMEALLDWHWQLTLDGQDLTEEEMDALAEAKRPLVRLRDRWILADELTLARARTRDLGRLPTREALTSALAGTLAVDGHLVACRPAGGLATVVIALRTGHAAGPAIPAPDGLAATLRPYQQRALEWLVRLTDLRLCPLLADDMGLGKTLVTLAFALHRRPHAEGPVLVICPTSVLDTWQREAARFTPALNVVRYHGAGRHLDAASLGAGTLVVTSYGTLLRDADQLAASSWDLVVADEAHVINSGTSGAALAIRRLTAHTRLAVTGTPVENESEEMWALMDWLNPGLLGTRATFRRRIGRHTAREADGEAAQLLARLTGPFVLRRLKTDPEIAPDLPEKIRTLHPVTLSSEQAALYEALVRETMEDLKARPSTARSGRVLGLLHDLRKIVNDPAVYLDEPLQEAAADLARARCRSAKLHELLTVVDHARAAGEQILICVNYLPVGHLLTAYLDTAGHQSEFFHGATPAKVRTRIVNDFQAGRLPVLILSVKAGGVGLTLTAATQVIHYDSPWTNTALEQASDRAYRIGQTRTVHVRRLVARGTVEERIEQLLAHKGNLADAVLPSGEIALAHLNDQDLTALVALGSH